MGIGRVFRRAWSRHNEHLIQGELMRETTGVDLPGLVEKAAAVEAVEPGPIRPAIQVASAEADARRESHNDDSP